MRLSKLQKYILLQSFDSKSKLDRKVLLGFYSANKKKPGSAKAGPSRETMVNSITSSMERLIKKGLIVGFGEFTQFKNFIYKIRLTPLGRKLAKKFLGEQGRLPLKMTNNLPSQMLRHAGKIQKTKK